MSFRKLQSILDLRRVAIKHLEAASLASTSLDGLLMEALQKSPSGRKPNWKLDLTSEACREIHVRVACAENESEFLAASCVLLLDRFEHTERGSDFSWEWDEFSARYRSADAPTRAAIMNGLDEARKHLLVSENVRPSISDCTTKPVQEVLVPLHQVAKSLSAEERELVAQADYGQDVEQHLGALNKLLATENCIYPPGETWFPAEVVELASHNSLHPGFAGCTAIVLINAIADEDAQSDAEFRWKANRFSYETLAPFERNAIRDGYRHLYETLRDWNPFSDQFESERLQADNFLPL